MTSMGIYVTPEQEGAFNSTQEGDYIGSFENPPF